MPNPPLEFLKRQPLWRLAVAVVAVGAAIFFWSRHAGVTSEAATFTARRGPLQITVLEGGSMQAVDSQEIKCEVRVGYQGTKILKIVEEGYLVTDEDVNTNKVLIEETNATTTPREMLEIRNKGGSVLIYEDTSVAQRWATGTSGANFLLDEQAHTGVEYIFTNTGNLTIAGVLTQGSSRDLKTDFTSLDPKDVLARVSALPVSLWSYKTENAVRHVGPMAEDFHQAFGLGADDKHIAPGDQAGVALLAVQGLDQLLQSKGQEIATLQRENADLAKRVEALEAMLSKVMSAKAAPDEQTP
jgi:hypothetical protein